MMELFQDKYKALYGKIAEPSPLMEKDEQYYRQKVQYFYTQFAHEYGSIVHASTNFSSSRRTTKELRDYGRGLQNLDKYLRELGYGEKELDRFRRDNISYQPFPIWTRFRNQIMNRFLDMNLKANTYALDEHANVERVMKANELKLVRQQATREMVPKGTMPGDEFPSYLSTEDIDFLMRIGEIRLQVEIMIKDALDISFYKSGMPTLQKMWLEDFVDLGGMACDLELMNNIQKVVYVDYGRTIVRSSIYPDYRDSDVRGYTTVRKVSELLMIDEQAIRNNFDQLRESYKAVYPYDPAIMYNQQQGFREDYSFNQNPYGQYADFGTTIAKFYWLDTDTERYVVGRHPRGSKIFERVGADFTLSERGERAGKVIQEFPIQYMHRASWVVGTDIMFDYGKTDIIVRQGQNGAKEIVWPMGIYSSNEPSLTEKVIPFIDDIQIALLKKRDLIAKIPPGPRMVIYKDKLRETIRLNNEDYSIRQLVKMYQREGLLVLERAQEYTLPGDVPANKNQVIEFIESGVAEDIAITDESINAGLRRIQETTGMNPVADGTASQGDMLKSVVESLRLSANSALRPWMESYVVFYQNLSAALAWRYQLITAFGEFVLGTLPLHEGLGRLVKIGPDLLKYDLGIAIEVNDAQYYQFLMQDLLTKRELLPAEAYFLVYNALNQGDLRKAEYYLIRFTQMAKQQEHERQMQIVQAQAASNAQAGVAVEQERQKIEMTKLEGELYKLREQAIIAEEQAKRDHSRRMTEIQFEKSLEKDMAVATVRENRSKELPNVTE